MFILVGTEIELLPFGSKECNVIQMEIIIYNFTFPEYEHDQDSLRRTTPGSLCRT